MSKPRLPRWGQPDTIDSFTAKVIIAGVAIIVAGSLTRAPAFLALFTFAPLSVWGVYKILTWPEGP